MANITYIFGDILTGSILEEISLFGVSMTRGFGSGDFRGAFQLDQTGKSNSDLIAATEEGRCFVVCERGPSVIWGGFVRTRTYQSQSKTLQLYCQAWEHYPEYRFMRSATFENLNTEQRNIFINLWAEMMTDPNSIQFTLPSAMSDVVLKSLTAKDFEFKYYRSLMDSLANADDGFDWTIDVQKVAGAYPRSLRIGYPTLGATNPIDFDYPGSVVNYWNNGTMSGHGTHFYGVGSGEGSTVLQQEVIHSDLISSGFPRFDAYVSFKDITSQEILTGLTTQAAIIRKPGVPIITIELKGDKEPEFGSYGLGDAARIHFDDPLHSEPVTQTIDTRILGWEYYPPEDDHTEMARLIFQGEET